MSKITVYQKPTCTTCRSVYKILKEKDVDFDAVDYYTDPIPTVKIKELLGKMKISANDLLRKKESVYKETILGREDLTEKEIIQLMAEYPDLIQRPIVEVENKAILARPAERINEIL